MPFGVSASFHARAGSTMDLARSYDGAQGFPHWILAGTQTHARGRQGRSWLSPAGAFSASLVMQPRCSPSQAAQRSFVAACALRRALASVVDAGALAQKWPNDVLLNGGKVAGILLESFGSGQLVERLTIGIGVNLGHAPQNVAQASFAPIGVADVTGQSLLPDAFLSIFAAEFAAVEAVLDQQGFAEVRAEWTAHAARLGENITARTGREEIIGRFEGLDAQGNLLLLTAGGKRVIPAADIYF
ncbi:MAG: biotin--[acetyl-CoA-carboxylase] ligase [Planktomarina sp.]|nr:biotin--[acetyl-CoA-carboxylase] ligase [Planktomarina sp.]